MTLANGRPYLAIPGPSVVPDRVLAAMHRAAPNIYAQGMIDLTAGLVADLKRVAGTAHHCAIYIANGHGAWEAALANVLARGDRVLVLATGRFGHGWGEMAARLGAEREVLDFGLSAPIDPERVAAALAADRDHRIRAVMCTQVDTATSVKNDIAALRAVLDAAGHPALLLVDCIACLGCDPFDMDALGVDVMVTGSQKGLMTPPGLGFVFFSDKADAARDRAEWATTYWDWRPRVQATELWQYFDGTAPTHHLFGLRAAMDMIMEEGLPAVHARHERLARAVWAAVEVWGHGGPIALNVADPVHRSHAVTTVRIGAPQGERLRAWVEANAGVTLGIGLGMAPPGDPAGAGFFRIGHMGHVNAHMVLGALGAIEAGMGALGVPFGPGGVSAAARVVSGV